MRCPHCGEEVEFIGNYEEKILQQIKEEDFQTIASIQRKLGIPRSSMIYYINSLAKDNKIKLTKLIHLTGQPVIISFIDEKKQ
jgi:predicted transcriptional regulator